MTISASSLTPRTCPRFLSYAPLPLPPPQFSFHSLLLPSKQLPHPIRALRVWQEYEETVTRKDLARALRFLKSIEKDNGDPVAERLKDGSLSIESPRPQLEELGFVVLEGPKDVTPSVLKSSTGLDVILDPIAAIQMGIQGQVLHGAFCWYRSAEAVVYGEAEDGEWKTCFTACVLLQPPLSVAQMSNQARWSVLQSLNLLKWHRHAYGATVRAFESGGGLRIVIRRIEQVMSSGR